MNAQGWDKQTLRDPHARADKAARVQAMFDAIAKTYERVNTVASFGRDAAWRRAAVAAADVRADDVVLDVACGTGDMMRAFAAGLTRPAQIVGVDFSVEMLAAGAYRGLATPVHLLRGDAQRLPLADQSVDVVSCAFGVRNFQSLQQGLDEMRRVLRPGGRVVILEFAVPENALLAGPHRLYTRHILPRLGKWLSGDAGGAYSYLPQSVSTFEQPQAMIQRLREAGLEPVTTRTMNLGGVVLYRGVRPVPD